MRDFFTFGGVASTDFGCYAADVNQFDAPARDVEIISVPGRNGTLSVDNGRFEDQTQTYTVYTRGDIRTGIGGLRDHLAQTAAYRRLEDTFAPDEFYLARFTGKFAVTQSDRHGAGFLVSFDRNPQRFLKSGEIPVTFTSAGVLLNGTSQAAKPLIRAYGTGSFGIAGVTVTITKADGYTDIDCDLQEAYKDTYAENRNGYVAADEFPQLVPGENAIAMQGITRLDITPRWWRL